MAPTFKIVFVVLASLQLAQQASLSNEYYDTKDLNSPLHNKLAFHSRFNVLANLKSKQSVDHERQIKSNEERKNFNLERGSVSNFRSKRQLEQDAEINAEIISNDPKMFSHGKSMPMTATDSETDEHHHEKHERDSWNEDVDTANKNTLEGLEEKPEDDETSNQEEDANKSQSKIQASTLNSQFQDISTAKDASITKMVTGDDNIDGRSSETAQSNDSVIRIVPTVFYEGHVSKENEFEQDKSKLASLEMNSNQQGNTRVKDDDDNDEELGVITDEEDTTQNSQDLEETDAIHNLKKDTDDSSDTEAIHTEDKPQKNEMQSDEVVMAHEGKHSNEVIDRNVGINKIGDKFNSVKDAVQVNKTVEETLSKEVDIDDNEGALREQLDKEDVDVFIPFPAGNSGSKKSLEQLKLPEEDDRTGNLEEGSGDMESDPTGSHETNYIHHNGVSNSSDNTPSVDISSKKDTFNFNIDSDSDTDKTNKEHEVKEKQDEKEIAAPIPDPTDIVSSDDDLSKTIVLSEDDEDEEKGVEEEEEVPIPDPTENISNVDDLSKTYDPTKSINPFNMYNPSEVSRTIGKVLGIIDNSEETTDGEELEGSGQPIWFNDTEFDKNSLENGVMIKIDPRMLGEDDETEKENDGDATTNSNDVFNEKEVTEEPIVPRHHVVQFNPARISANETNIVHVTQDPTNLQEIGKITTEVITSNGSIELPPEVTTLKIPLINPQFSPEHGQRMLDPSSMSENGSALPLPAGINEMGIKNGEKEVSTENVDEASSSSTGSFIVLGAIMATIVALLGYSVIKSHRQKQQASRRPPEDDLGTELKEIETLLQEKNGHGPANRLNVEGERLLSPSGENDTNGLKPDGRYPIYQNGVHGESGQPTDVLQIEDPNNLSEVKVQKPTSVAPNNLDNLTPTVPVNTPVANGLGSKNSSGDSHQLGGPKSPPGNDRGSYGTKPETAKIKMFIDHDSIPKTPIVIVKRGPANVEK